MKILGLHIRDTKNHGDRNCHPLDYIDFSSDDIQVSSADVRTIEGSDDIDLVVLGGGAIGYTAQDVRKLFPHAKLVGWGIGCSHRQLEPVRMKDHLKVSEGYDIWGARDNIKGLDLAPCASCMHPYFDNIPSPQHDLVIFGHKGALPLQEQAEKLGVPYLDNTTGKGFLGVLDHLASGAKVISSSYHGAYWATLMGRKVSMVPFGSKFFSLKYKPPAVAIVSDGIKAAKAFPDALPELRTQTLAFKAKVDDLIEEIRRIPKQDKP